MSEIKIGNKQIGFFLRGIKTEQYATLENDFNDKAPVGGGLQVKFGVNLQENTIAQFSKFLFEQEGKPIMVIEVSCHFGIEPESFKSIINTELKQVVLPQEFASHIVTITVGATRGILHSKVENTKYNQFIIPLVDVTEVIKEDAIIKYETEISN